MDKVIAELQKAPLEKLVISQREYQGHGFIDIRLHFLADDEQWHPTKKGVTVGLSLWSEFKEAVLKVEAHLPTDAASPAGRRSSQEGHTR